MVLASLVIAALTLSHLSLGTPMLAGQTPGLYVKTPAGYATLTEAELQKLPVADWEVWYYRAGEPPKPPSHPWGMESAKTREAAERMMKSAQYWEPRCNEMLGKGFVNEPIYTHFNAIGPIAIVKRPGVSPRDTQASSLLAKLVSERERASEVLEFLRTAKELDGPVSKILGYRTSTASNPYAGIGSAVKEYARNVQDSLHQADLMGRMLDGNLTRLTSQFESSLGKIGQDEENVRKRLSDVTVGLDRSNIKLPGELDALGQRLVDPRHASSSYVDDNGGWGRSLGEGSYPLNPIDVRNRVYMPRFGSPRELKSSSMPGVGITKDVDTDGGFEDPIAILYWQDYYIGAPKYVVEYARLYARDNPDSLDPSKGRSKALHELRSFSSTGFESHAAATPEAVHERQREFRSWVRHYALDLSQWIAGVQAVAGPPIPPKEIAENAVALKPLAALLIALLGAYRRTEGQAKLNTFHEQNFSRNNKIDHPSNAEGQSDGANAQLITHDQARSPKAIFRELDGINPTRLIELSAQYDKAPYLNAFEVYVTAQTFRLERDGEVGEYVTTLTNYNLGGHTNPVAGKVSDPVEWTSSSSAPHIDTFKFRDLDSNDIAVDTKGSKFATGDWTFVRTLIVHNDFEYISPSALGLRIGYESDPENLTSGYCNALMKKYEEGEMYKVVIGTIDDRKTISHVRYKGARAEMSSQENKIEFIFDSKNHANKFAALMKELIQSYQT